MTGIENDTLLAEFRATTKVGGLIGQKMLQRIIDFLTGVAIRKMKEQNPNLDEAAAREAIAEAVRQIGDGKIWDWLVNGGFEQVLQWILFIIQAFA